MTTDTPISTSPSWGQTAKACCSKALCFTGRGLKAAPGGLFRFFNSFFNNEDAMFGKPEWFRLASYGLAPVAKQGRIYLGVLAGLISLPVLSLLVMGKMLEAGVWLLASTGFTFWDVRQVRKQIRDKENADKMLYIKEEDEDETRLKTQNYDLQVRE